MNRKKKGRNMKAIELLADQMTALAAKEMGHDVLALRGFRNRCVRHMVDSLVERQKPTPMRGFLAVWAAFLSDTIKEAGKDFHARRPSKNVGPMLGEAVGMKNNGWEFGVNKEGEGT